MLVLFGTFVSSLGRFHGIEYSQDGRKLTCAYHKGHPNWSVHNQMVTRLEYHSSLMLMGHGVETDAVRLVPSGNHFDHEASMVVVAMHHCTILYHRMVMEP